jgi:hypothetical protein
LRDRKAAPQFGAGVQADFQYFGFYRGLSWNGIVKIKSQGKEESQGQHAQTPDFEPRYFRLEGGRRLGELGAFEFDAGGAEVGEVIVGLLGKPGFGAATEDFGEGDGHFGRDASVGLRDAPWAHVGEKH